jgi:hypothetical protein
MTLLFVWFVLSVFLAAHWVVMDVPDRAQDIRTNDEDFFRLAMAVVPFVLLRFKDSSIEGERHRAVETGFLMSRSLLGDPPQPFSFFYLRKLWR